MEKFYKINYTFEKPDIKNVTNVKTGKVTEIKSVIPFKGTAYVSADTNVEPIEVVKKFTKRFLEDEGNKEKHNFKVTQITLLGDIVNLV